MTALKAVACSLALLMTAPLPYAQDAKPANAADASAQTTTLHVDVNVVSMAVTVRDKHGKIVPNLTKDDFTLQDDNHPQTIKYFNVDPNLPLTMGLLVDTSGSLRDAVNDERSATQKFFDQMLTQKQDRAFLIEFNREVDLLADPTSKHEVLEKALDHLGEQQFSADAHRDPPNSGDPDQSDGGGNNSNGHGRRFASGGTMLYDAIYLASDEVMSKEKGRKALIVLTDGEDRGSKETLHTAIEAAQRADTVVYAMYFKGEEHNNNNNNGGFPGHRGGMGGGWPGGGGGGWPGGGGGGYPGGGGGNGGGQRPEKTSVDGKKVLEQICGETGGRMFEVKKKELIEDIYNQIAEELRSQYVLGYTPDKTVAGGGYHRITLLPKKKEYFAQTRQGYYAQE